MSDTPFVVAEEMRRPEMSVSGATPSDLVRSDLDTVNMNVGI